MPDTIEDLRRHEEACRELALTAETNEGRDALLSMADDYAHRAMALRRIARSKVAFEPA